jgi:hypothetical protein
MSRAETVTCRFRSKRACEFGIICGIMEFTSWVRLDPTRETGEGESLFFLNASHEHAPFAPPQDEIFPFARILRTIHGLVELPLNFHHRDFPHASMASFPLRIQLTRNTPYLCRRCAHEARLSTTPTRGIQQSFRHQFSISPSLWTREADNKNGKRRRMLSVLEERGYINQIAG